LKLKRPRTFLHEVQRPSDRDSLLAAREASAGAPDVGKPVEVENPAPVVEVEVRDVEVAVRIALKYTACLPKHHPLNILEVEFYLKMLSP
jgi:hypothetical protein